MDYENINLNSNEYTKLSNEEKLKLVKSRIDSILNEKADKHQFTVVYKGKRIKINKDKQGSLRDLASRERSLEKRINDKKRQEESKKIELELSEKNEVEVTKEDNNKKNALIDNYREIALDTDYYKNLSVEDKIKEINREKKSHSNLINEKLYPNDEESKEYIDFLDDLLVKLNAEAISNRVSDQDDIVDSTNEEKKSKGILALLMGLPLVSRIKNRKSKKDSIWRRKFNKKKKRIGAAICAGIIAVTGIIGLKSCNNTNNKNSDNNINTSVTDIDDSNKNDIPEIISQDIDTEDIIDDTISLNDTVTIDNGSPIYTNSYDASYNTNGYNALYDGSYDRIIEAVSYELNGVVYTVYRNEDNSYEKVDELIKKGATLTSVLVTRVDLANDITHEGYYNVSNVRVRSR